MSDTAEALSGLISDISAIGLAPSESSQLSAEENGKLIELLQLLSDRESERYSKVLRVRRILVPRLDEQEPPVNRLHCCLKIDLLATAKDGLGEHEHQFQAFVCTASWMSEEMRERRWTWFAPSLVVERWDTSLIRESLAALSRTTAGSSWQSFQEQLVGRFAWESLRVQDVDG